MRAVRYITPIDEETGDYEVLGDNFIPYIRSLYGAISDPEFIVDNNNAKALFVDTSWLDREVYFDFVDDTEILPEDFEPLESVPEFEPPKDYNPEGYQPEYWVPDNDDVPEDNSQDGIDEGTDEGPPVDELDPDIPGDYTSGTAPEPPQSNEPGPDTSEDTEEPIDSEEWPEEFLPEGTLPDEGYEEPEPAPPDIQVNYDEWPVTEPSSNMYYPVSTLYNSNLEYEEYSWMSNWTTSVSDDLSLARKITSNDADTVFNDMLIKNNNTYISPLIGYTKDNYTRISLDIQVQTEKLTTPGRGAYSFIMQAVGVDSIGNVVTTRTIENWNVVDSFNPETTYRLPDTLFDVANMYQNFAKKPTTDSETLERAGTMPPNFLGNSVAFYVLIKFNDYQVQVSNFKVYSDYLTETRGLYLVPLGGNRYSIEGEGVIPDPLQGDFNIEGIIKIGEDYFIDEDKLPPESGTTYYLTNGFGEDLYTLKGGVVNEFMDAETPIRGVYNDQGEYYVNPAEVVDE